MYNNILKRSKTRHSRHVQKHVISKMLYPGMENQYSAQTQYVFYKNGTASLSFTYNNYYFYKISAYHFPSLIVKTTLDGNSDWPAFAMPTSICTQPLNCSDIL